MLEASAATIYDQSTICDDPPVLHSCLEIPTPAPTDSHDSAMGELISMTRRSDEQSAYE